jgi:hypothetical protein
MRDTGKVEETPLTCRCTTMYSVYFSNLTRLTCRYHSRFCPGSGNFRKQAPHAGNELYLFVGDVPVSGRVSPQYVTPHVQCAGCRGRAKATPVVPPNRRQVRPMGDRQSHRPTGIPSPTRPTESIRSGSRSEAMAAGA